MFIFYVDLKSGSIYKALKKSTLASYIATVHVIFIKALFLVFIDDKACPLMKCLQIGKKCART